MAVFPLTAHTGNMKQGVSGRIGSSDVVTLKKFKSSAREQT